MFSDVVPRTCYWTPSEQSAVTLQVENGKYCICRFLYFNHICYNFFPTAQHSLVVHSLLFVEASRPHSDTLHSVGFLWTSDQTEAETSTRQLTILSRDRLSCHRRNSNPQSQVASSRRPTP